MALEQLADAGPEALRLFDAGEFDAAALEVERAAKAVNVVRRVRRQAGVTFGAWGMTYVELKTYAAQCDICLNRSTPVLSEREPSGLPNGWTTRDLSDCGMTGYSRTDAICPGCATRLARARTHEQESGR